MLHLHHTRANSKRISAKLLHWHIPRHSRDEDRFPDRLRYSGWLWRVHQHRRIGAMYRGILVSQLLAKRKSDRHGREATSEISFSFFDSRIRHGCIVGWKPIR